MIGFTSVTFRKLPAERIISLCAEAGLQAIEWGGDIHVLPGDIERAAEIAQKTTDAGLKVSSYGSYYRVGVDPISDFEIILATAKALGAPLIRVWCGNKGSKNTTEQDAIAYINQLRQMCEIALGQNVFVACEYHNDTYNDNAECALKLINGVNMPNFKTYWQTIAYTEEDLAALIRLKKHIAVAHVFTWDKNYNRFPLESKGKFWKKYINELKGESVNFILEFVKNDSEKQFLKDAAYLKKLVER